MREWVGEWVHIIKITPAVKPEQHIWVLSDPPLQTSSIQGVENLLQS